MKVECAVPNALFLGTGEGPLPTTTAVKLTPQELDALVWREIRNTRGESHPAELSDSDLIERAKWYVELAVGEASSMESLPDAIRLLCQLWPES